MYKIYIYIKNKKITENITIIHMFKIGFDFMEMHVI